MTTTKNTRIGVTRLNTQNEKMTIIEYKGAKDVTVQFGDGAIREHVQYYNFEKGQVRHPIKIVTQGITRIGETRVNNQNERMEIIDYKNAACMTVRFDDGTVHHNVQYHNFCKGRVKKTESKEIKKSQAAEQKFGAMECRTDRIGEERFNTKNERMKIINYNNTHDITVRFDDGTIKAGVHYRHFLDSYVKKPKISDEKVNSNSNKDSRKSLGQKGMISEVCEEAAYKADQKESFLKSAESYRVSAIALSKEKGSTPIDCIVLCKKAVTDYLRFVTGAVTEDVRHLGKMLKDYSITVDPRDLAWLHDFNFEMTENWIKPTADDVIMAIKIMNNVHKEIIDRK